MADRQMSASEQEIYDIVRWHRLNPELVTPLSSERRKTFRAEPIVRPVQQQSALIS